MIDLYDKKEKLISENVKDRDDHKEELNVIENQISKRILESQTEKFENNLEKLKENKTTKGSASAIFKLKESVVGSKKSGQEAIVITDPVSKKKLFEKDKIKEASAIYVQNLLKNNLPIKEYEMEIKVKNLLHDIRITEEVENDDEEEFTEETF